MFARSAPVRPDVSREIAFRSTSAARVHQEDRLAALQVGRLDQDLPVEAARAQQRRVEILEAVGRAHDDDLVARAEPVELDEQLVQRLILLAVERVAAARHADRIELVDEHDRRRILARLFEQLADAGCAEPGEHLDERRGTLRVEARTRCVRDRLRGERLAGAGRTVEEDALRDASAERLEALRIAEEVDDLLQLPLRLVETGDVVPGDGRLGAGRDLHRLHPRHELDRPPEQVDDHAHEREEHDRKPRQRKVGHEVPEVEAAAGGFGDRERRRRGRRRRAGAIHRRDLDAQHAPSIALGGCVCEDGRGWDVEAIRARRVALPPLERQANRRRARPAAVRRRQGLTHLRLADDRGQPDVRRPGGGSGERAAGKRQTGKSGREDHCEATHRAMERHLVTHRHSLT
jgi:hypothetical protein